jgi:hypothetical protein
MGHPPRGFGVLLAWCLSPLWKQKSPREAGFFFFYPISSGYHMVRIRPPKYFEGIKM